MNRWVDNRIAACLERRVECGLSLTDLEQPRTLGLGRVEIIIAEAALQEDVNIVGLSILSGAHMALAPRVLALLKANGQEDVKVFLGGIIPDEDIDELKNIGVSGVYGPGTSTDEIIEDIRRGILTEASS